jgi:hypothetical protein
MPEIVTKVVGGKISGGRQTMIDFLVKHEGKDIFVTFDVIGENKTLKQLNYYWAAVIKTVENDLGWERGSLHEYLKLKFNPIEQVDLLTGEVKVFGGSTKLMTKERYREYIHHCIVHLLEAGCHVPEPEEYFQKPREQK